MGYEYAFVFNSPLDSPQVARLFHRLQTIHPWFLIQAEEQMVSCLLRYAYAASGPISWDEDFLLEVSSHEVYLLLHTATGDQEANVLTWLQQCTAILGLTGTLAEL
jgi:hypothetical protein